MSLTSLADEEVIRTSSDLNLTRLRDAVNRHLLPVATRLTLAANVTDALRDNLVPLAAETPTQRTPASQALDSLARYVPTEAITLYIAALSAISAIHATFPFIAEKVLYWSFAALTPVLFVLIYAGKRINDGQPALPASVSDWPWWKTVASAIAFLVWALAVPGTPYFNGESGKIVAAFGAVLVSTFLTLLEPFFQRR
ncbi:MAG TPA: hypothetical protein VF913_21865 [Xanthobacteraceae bacterium]